MTSFTFITARYQETDKMGIIHHSVYPIWYEEARTNFTKEMGMSYSKMEETGILTPLVSLTSNYKKPAFYEDTVKVSVSISELTPIKIIFSYTITKDETIINTGTTTHVFASKDLKIINIKKEFPEVYEMIEKCKQ